MKMRTAFLAGIALAFAPAAGVPAMAQSDYPNQPVQLTAGFPGGGTIDSINRLIVECIDFDGEVVAVPQPGAGGTIASADVAKATPDGYTLLLEPSGVLLSRPIFAKLTFSHESFEPIATVGASVTGIKVPASSRFSNWAEMETFARENPGQLLASTSGVGSLGHLALVTLAERHGIEITHVPFPNGPEAIGAAVGGHVDMFFGDNLHPELSMLVTSHTERVARLPDTPTFAELGLDGMSWVVRVMMSAPKDTPEDILRTWETKLEDVVQSSCYADGMDRLGWAPLFEGRDRLLELWPEEFERNKAIIESLGAAYYQ